ncbi:Homeobox protein BarH-like 1 [Branchiostoma belcheri]|nr:Homeobox protein BarH-like 1 [Branchiostoma belcheri]
MDTPLANGYCLATVLQGGGQESPTKPKGRPRKEQSDYLNHGEEQEVTTTSPGASLPVSSSPASSSPSPSPSSQPVTSSEPKEHAQKHVLQDLEQSTENGNIIEVSDFDLFRTVDAIHATELYRTVLELETELPDRSIESGNRDPFGDASTKSQGRRHTCDRAVPKGVRPLREARTATGRAARGHCPAIKVRVVRESLGEFNHRRRWTITRIAVNR